MNLFAFTKNFTNYLETAFEQFLQTNKDKLETAEFFLPSIVSNLIKEGVAETKVISTSNNFFFWLLP